MDKNILGWEISPKMEYDCPIADEIPYALVMEKDIVDAMSIEEKIKLTREHRVDYIVMRDKQKRKFYRYFKEEKEIKVGDIVDIRGNVFTSLGEGIYCYGYEEGQILEEMKGRTIAIMEGDVTYYTIIFDNDGEGKEEDKEILIPPGQDIRIIKIINT